MPSQAELVEHELAKMGVPGLAIGIIEAKEMFKKYELLRIKRLACRNGSHIRIFKIILGQSFFRASALYRLIAEYRAEKAIETIKQELAAGTARQSVLMPVGKPCKPIPVPYRTPDYVLA